MRRVGCWNNVNLLILRSIVHSFVRSFTRLAEWRSLFLSENMQKRIVCYLTRCRCGCHCCCYFCFLLFHNCCCSNSMYRFVCYVMLNVILSLTIFDCSIYFSLSLFLILNTARVIYFPSTVKSIFINSPHSQRVSSSYYYLIEKQPTVTLHCFRCFPALLERRK